MDYAVNNNIETSKKETTGIKVTVRLPEKLTERNRQSKINKIYDILSTATA